MEKTYALNASQIDSVVDAIVAVECGDINFEEGLSSLHYAGLPVTAYEREVTGVLKTNLYRGYVLDGFYLYEELAP